MKCEIDDLSKALFNTMSTWSDEKCREAIKVTKKKGNELVEAIKRDSPSSGHKSKKNYKNGWKAEVSEGKQFIRVKGINKNKPGLTHLLENGHQIFVGTTSGKNKQVHSKGGRSRAIPHIKKNEKEKNEELIAEIEEVFK